MFANLLLWQGGEIKLDLDDGTTAAGDDITTLADSTIADSTVDIESTAAGAPAATKSALTAAPPMVPVPEVKGKPRASSSSAPKKKGRGAVSTARSPALSNKSKA